MPHAEGRPVYFQDRTEWAADAERFTRTMCAPSERVSRHASDWLTPAELDEARTLAAAIVRATRTALTRAGRAEQRPGLNAAGREAARSAEVDDLRFAWRDILTKAARVDAAPEQAARLAALLTAMTRARDEAAEQALQTAIDREVARRNSDEGWAHEQARRAGTLAGPTVTELTARRDGTSTTSEPRPWRMPPILRRY